MQKFIILVIFLLSLNSVYAQGFNLFGFTPPSEDKIISLSVFPNMQLDKDLPMSSGQYYQLVLDHADTWYIQSYGEVDTEFTLYDENWKKLEKEVDGPRKTKQAWIEKKLEAGSYYLHVTGFLLAGGPYNLAVFSQEFLDAHPKEGKWGNNSADFFTTEELSLNDGGVLLDFSAAIDYEHDQDYVQIRLPDDLVNKELVAQVELKAESSTQLRLDYLQKSAQSEQGEPPLKKYMIAQSSSYKTEATLDSELFYTLHISGEVGKYQVILTLKPKKLTKE